MLGYVKAWPCLLVVAGILPAQFSDYWHQGKAEVNRYQIQRVRYGEQRAGYAVLIFVTEDVLRDKQVKDEHGAGDQAVNVLKLNRIERFGTGLYDYSLMQSTFTEARVAGKDLPPTLKFTASIQDWCGHVWLQANRRDRGFETVGHSYFESEADERATLPLALLEDEVFTQIRLGAERLPVGELQVIPSAFRVRLDHRPLRAEKASASLADLPRTPESELAEREYRLTIDLGGGHARCLRVRFAKAFPFVITGFAESLEFGDSTQPIFRAELQKTERIDYWTKNHKADEPLRAEFGLGPVR